MTADELARSVAKDLAPQLGSDLPSKTDAVIRGDATRGWGHLDQVMMVSSFIVHTASLVWDIYKETRDLPRVRDLVRQKSTPPAGMSQSEADMIIKSTVDRLSKQGT